MPPLDYIVAPEPTVHPCFRSLDAGRIAENILNAARWVLLQRKKENSFKLPPLKLKSFQFFIYYQRPKFFYETFIFLQIYLSLTERKKNCASSRVWFKRKGKFFFFIFNSYLLLCSFYSFSLLGFISL